MANSTVAGADISLSCETSFDERTVQGLSEVAAEAARLRSVSSPILSDALRSRQLLEQSASLLVARVRLPGRSLNSLHLRLGAVEAHYHLPRELARRLSAVRRQLNAVVHSDGPLPFNPEDVWTAADTLLALCKHFGIQPPAAQSGSLIREADDAQSESLEVIAPALPALATTGSSPSRVTSDALVLPVEPDFSAIQRLQVLRVETIDGGGLLLGCRHEEFDDSVLIELGLEWSTVIPPVSSTICTHKLQRMSQGNWKTSHDSLLVLEPDVLIHATDVANSFISDGTSPLVGMAGAMDRSSSSWKSVMGTIANAVLDDLVTSADPASPQRCVDQELANRALDLAQLSTEDEQQVVSGLQQQLPALTVIADRLRPRTPSIEQTLMSATYGLHGRPDYIVRGDSATMAVDLKSGSSPSTSVVPRHRAFAGCSGVWEDNAAQMICYRLLLRSAMGVEAETYPCYSQAVMSELKKGKLPLAALKVGLRQIQPSSEAERAVIIARNEIVALELAMLVPGSHTLAVAPTPPAKVADFKKPGMYRAARCAALAQRPPEAGAARAIWELIVRVMRALWTERLGNDDPHQLGESMASFWLETSMRKKAESHAAIGYLTPLIEQSDRAAGRYEFRFDQPGASDADRSTLQTNNLRKEDRVILFPHDGDRVAPLQGPLLKGSVAGLSHENGSLHVIIKVFSKSAWDDLRRHTHWAMQHDVDDSLAKAPLASLVPLLGDDSTERRVKVLLGLEPPAPPSADWAESERLRIEADGPDGDPLEPLAVRAASTSDYFLIQGPPGTGKTSRLLPAIIKSLAPSESQPVLALAFTNRAVREMRKALGSGERDASKPVFMLDPLYERGKSENDGAAIESAAALRGRLARTQIFVMTVASALKHLDLIKKKRFQTIIVDEASQLLDTQLLGILALGQRSILIGDENQLPPVQRDENPLPSTFERLLKICRDNAWSYAFGWLTKQYRMHEEIQRFPSEQFYNSRLKVADRPRQARPGMWGELAQRPEGHWSNALFEKRVAFVAVPEDDYRQRLTHAGEAQIVARIAREIQSRLPDKLRADPKAVGIIAPFRRQVAEIRRALGEDGTIDMDTVERFQGSERHVVIYSCTADDEAERLATANLSSEEDVDRKFNVTITRSREHLIVVGHAETLKQGKHTRAFLDHVRRHGRWVESAAIPLDDTN